MFKTKDVQALLQNLKFTGDGEDATAIATFYITPIKHALALEASPKIADRLFRRRAAEFVPCAEVPSIDFDVKIDAQAISYAVHQDVKQGRGHIPHASIGKIKAVKLFADNPDFTLEFQASFPVNDKDLMWQLINRLKKPLLLTFKKLQGEIDFPKPALLCEICNEPATHRTKPGQSLVCPKHIHAYVGEEVEALDPDAEEAATQERLQQTLEASEEGEGDGEAAAAGNGRPKAKRGAGKKKKAGKAGKPRQKK